MSTDLCTGDYSTPPEWEAGFGAAMPAAGAAAGHIVHIALCALQRLSSSDLGAMARTAHSDSHMSYSQAASQPALPFFDIPPRSSSSHVPAASCELIERTLLLSRTAFLARRCDCRHAMKQIARTEIHRSTVGTAASLCASALYFLVVHTLCAIRCTL